MITQVLPFVDLKHLVITPALLDPNSMVAVIGDLSKFSPHRIAVINSRQRRLPSADDPWLAATAAAVDRAISSNATIISSVGMIIWEWVVWNTARQHGYQIIVMPRSRVGTLQDRARQIIHDFDLDAGRTAFLMPFSPKDKPFRRLVYPERDRWVIALAHSIRPVAVNRSGTISRLLSELALSKIIDTSCQIAVSNVRRQKDVLKLLVSKTPNPENGMESRHGTSDWKDSRKYLTHWTRACHGPWPGEYSTDFYMDLHRSKTGYPRDGISTLRRMLTECKIRASGRMMPGGAPMISLTATSPDELLKIIRWRPGYIRWNFEPYGISIRKEILESLGAKKVIYGTKNHFEGLDSPQRPFFQRITQDKDWSVEKEWRLPGDLSLGGLNSNDVVVWVLNSDQVTEIQNVSPFPVIALRR